MNILAFTDALKVLPTIDAIAMAWDGGWPESADACEPSENPGVLVVECSGWQGCSRGYADDELFAHITVEVHNGEDVLSATFTDATEDEVVQMLGARWRSLTSEP